MSSIINPHQLLDELMLIRYDSSDSSALARSMRILEESRLRDAELIALREELARLRSSD